MYKIDEKAKAKLKTLIRCMKILLGYSFFIFTLCTVLITFGDGKLINLIPLVIFMIIWLFLFFNIYIIVAYRMPIEINFEKNNYEIISVRKTYNFNKNDYIEKAD